MVGSAAICLAVKLPKERLENAQRTSEESLENARCDRPEPMPSIETPVKTPIEIRVAQIFATRQITRPDQDFLMAVFASGRISTADEALINKLYEALNAGRLRVVE